MAEIKSVEILRLRVDFATKFQACVTVESRSEDVLDRERDLVQLFILSWVKLLLLLGPNPQAPMLVDYFQLAMGDTVTPKGLKRPVIMWRPLSDNLDAAHLAQGIGVGPNFIKVILIWLTSIA